MNEMQVFNFESNEVRTVEIDNNIWFVGKDVANILGYENASKALNDHVDEEDKLNNKTLASLGQRGGWLINESGMYSLILTSKLPLAKKFKRWVTQEVLPAIRKHGAYLTSEKVEEVLLNPDTIIQLATQLKQEREEKLQLQAENSKLTVNNTIMKPKADYFDDLVDKNLLTSFRDTAKELKVKEKIFINFLIEHKYIFRDKKGKLMPYAEKNKGLFEVKEFINEKTGFTGNQTLLTPKGRETFRLLLIGAA